MSFVQELSGSDSQGRAAKTWPWIFTALVFVLLSPVTAALSRTASGGWLIFFIVAQVMATGLAFLIPQWRELTARRKEATAEEREIEARVDTRVAMNDALDPILHLLGNLSLEPKKVIRNQLRAQVIPLVLKTAAEFIGPDRARACWFKLEPGPPKRLDPTEFAGRAGAPSTIFVAGNAAGDAAVDMVLADEERLVHDVESDPPPGWDPSTNREYRTFIAVSVLAGDTAYGMLTLDALEAGSLTSEDMALLRLMARVLAVAVSIP